jgi:hypothetical protein
MSCSSAKHGFTLPESSQLPSTAATPLAGRSQGGGGSTDEFGDGGRGEAMVREY